MGARSSSRARSARPGALPGVGRHLAYRAPELAATGEPGRPRVAGRDASQRAARTREGFFDAAFSGPAFPGRLFFATPRRAVPFGAMVPFFGAAFAALVRAAGRLEPVCRPTSSPRPPPMRSPRAFAISFLHVSCSRPRSDDCTSSRRAHARTRSAERLVRRGGRQTVGDVRDRRRSGALTPYGAAAVPRLRPRDRAHSGAGG